MAGRLTTTCRQIWHKFLKFILNGSLCKFVTFEAKT